MGRKRHTAEAELCGARRTERRGFPSREPGDSDGFSRRVAEERGESSADALDPALARTMAG